MHIQDYVDSLFNDAAYCDAIVWVGKWIEICDLDWSAIKADCVGTLFAALENKGLFSEQLYEYEIRQCGQTIIVSG